MEARRWVAVLAASTCGVVGCSSGVKLDEAVVTGSLYVVGGAPSLTNGTATRSPLPGRVVLTSSEHTISVAVGRDGRYAVRVPAGTYTVKGSTPNVQIETPQGTMVAFPCRAGS